MALMPDLSEARRLLDAGMHLVKLDRYSKRPMGDGWNRTEKRVTSIDAAATGYGYPLAQNRLCSIDPDNWVLAVRGMRALGFDLDAIMAHGVRTKSTRPGSGGRSTFLEEPDLSWLKFASRDPNVGVVLEFRADSPNLQDVVPGLVYCDKQGELCTQQYANGRRLDDAPALPNDLMVWWQMCSTDIEFLREQQSRFMQAIGVSANLAISTGRGIAAGKLAFEAPGYRTDFNQAHTVESILTRHGYNWHQKEQRWSPPTATGAPGVKPIPGKDGLWRSDHASDPLSGTFDAWVAFVVLDHFGNVETAKAAFDAERNKGIDFSALLNKIPTASEQAAKSKPQDAAPWLIPADDFSAQPAPISWLVKHWIQANALIMVHGPSGGGKTFAVLDWCLRMAAGLPDWAGHKVKQGTMVYLAGEGHHGLRGRVAAWKHKHGVVKLDMWLSRDGCDLNTPEGYLRVVNSIREAGIVPSCISVDTLHRFLSGDENSAQDAKTMLDACNSLMREFNCSVILVHHTGVSDEAQHRARGSSAWKGALDIEISVIPGKNGSPMQIVQRKVKDAEFAEPIYCELESVEIPGWIDEDGEKVTSATINIVGAPEKAVGKKENELNKEINRFKRAWFASGAELSDGLPYISRSGLIRYLMENENVSEATAKTYAQASKQGRLIYNLMAGEILSPSGHGWVVSAPGIAATFSLLDGGK